MVVVWPDPSFLWRVWFVRLMNYWFYWLFYSLVHCWDPWINSSDDSTPNLWIILLLFYWSFYTDDLLACYWRFYFHSTDHSKRSVGEEISRARNQQKHTLPLAPKLQTQAASGGMCFVNGWPCRTSRSSVILDEGWELRWKQAGETVHIGKGQWYSRVATPLPSFHKTGCGRETIIDDCYETSNEWGD